MKKKVSVEQLPLVVTLKGDTEKRLYFASDTSDVSALVSGITTEEGFRLRRRDTLKPSLSKTRLLRKELKRKRNERDVELALLESVDNIVGLGRVDVHSKMLFKIWGFERNANFFTLTELRKLLL